MVSFHSAEYSSRHVDSELYCFEEFGGDRWPLCSLSVTQSNSGHISPCTAQRVRSSTSDPGLVVNEPAPEVTLFSHFNSEGQEASDEAGVFGDRQSGRDILQLRGAGMCRGADQRGRAVQLENGQRRSRLELGPTPLSVNLGGRRQCDISRRREKVHGTTVVRIHVGPPGSTLPSASSQPKCRSWKCWKAPLVLSPHFPSTFRWGLAPPLSGLIALSIS